MKVSIITIVYNRENEIEQTIQSVINQDYSEIEYLIIDGGSTDSTLYIIDKYKSHISICISEPDKGIYDAINKGIDMATGEIVGMVHAGDMLFNNKVISNVVNTFLKTGTDIVYGNTMLVDPLNTDKVVRIYEGGEFNPNQFLTGWMPSHSSTYIRRSLFLKFGSYRLDLDIAADYELLIRFMFKHSVNSSYYPGLITRFRVGGISNRNLISFLRSGRQCYKAWKLNGLKIPFYTIPLKFVRRIPDILFRKSRLKKYVQ